MSINDNTWNRLAATILFAEKCPNLGRTALMKFVFMLQVLREVRLDYNFGLYTYGPFDSNVLGDLSYAESLGVLTEHLEIYPNGYGYSINVGDHEQAQKVLARAKNFIEEHDADIEWVVKKFRSRSAADLEIISTIIYVDRITKERGHKLSPANLAANVHDVKPHHDVDKIDREIGSLAEDGLLVATS